MEELDKNITQIPEAQTEEELVESLAAQAVTVEEDDPKAVYPLDSEKVYYSSDKLTLEDEDGPKTMKMGVWICYDPVRIHKMIIREKILKVDEIEVLNPLVSKLRKADPDYYKRFMGLRLVIDFPGYGSGIIANIPFETDPVGFYKWWRKGKHEDKVYLSLGNQIKLFQKVSMMEPKLVLKKDLEILGL